MCEIENVLRQRRGLDDAPDLDGAFFFDESADGVEQAGGELHTTSDQHRITETRENSDGRGRVLTSEYHLACQAISLIRQPRAGIRSPVRSWCTRTAFMALGEKRVSRQLAYASTDSSPRCSLSASSPRISHSSDDFLYCRRWAAYCEASVRQMV